MYKFYFIAPVKKTEEESSSEEESSEDETPATAKPVKKSKFSFIFLISSI